ncbi:MAG: zinc transporter ZupT [Candidatus Zixiibacteriota bacterium]|nr:MAG: zinc transporter ZupT [candidate division Zixibacteria bacterium]
MDKNVGLALLLTTLAGLSTTLGSLLGLAVRKPGPRFMSATLGFSAGVMVLVSFVELLQGGIESIGFAYAHFGFFIGIIFIFAIDYLLPHQWAGHHDLQGSRSEDRLLRMGLLVALGVGIHNFPEGMATFAGTLKDTKLGVAIAVAIAIHNIPEGLAVSAPVYAATKSRGKAFFWSFISGLAEPAGAGVAAVFLLPFLTPALLGWILAFVAGVMVYIAFDELIPTSRSYGREHTAILGVILGMVVMSLSLWMLK